MINKLSYNDIEKITRPIEHLEAYGHYHEVFKQIIISDTPLPYLVSSYGRILSIHYRGVKRITPHILKPKYDKYVQITLAMNGINTTYLVHRLVALAFIDNPDNKPEVNHKDGDKHNNCIWNLEWVTRKENDTHAILNGLKKPRHGEEIGNNKFTDEMVTSVCTLLEANTMPIKDISEITGVSYDMIRNIKNGKSWTHISKHYDFSSYSSGVDISVYNNKIKMIKKVCKLLSTNKYTLRDISTMTGISEPMVYKIWKKEAWTHVSKYYKIENYRSKSIKSK